MCSRLQPRVTTLQPCSRAALQPCVPQVREQDELLGQEEAAAVLDFFFEMRRADGAYTCVGRTPKTIRTALEAYVASTTSFGADDDEIFQPNP